MRWSEALEAHGYVTEDLGGSGALTYRIETREMDGPAWDPIHASLQIVGQSEPLMTLSSNINLMAAYSHSTPGGGVEGELVDVGRGSPQDFEGMDVQGEDRPGGRQPRPALPKSRPGAWRSGRPGLSSLVLQQT